MTDLLDAVDDLTKPDRFRVIQDLLEPITDPETGDVPTVRDSGGIPEGFRHLGTQKIPVTVPPLLEQLDAAISSSLGGSTAGAKLASEGAVLNVGALYEAMKIAAQVGDWCVAAKITRTKDTAKDLRAWYTHTLAHPLDDEHETGTILILARWASTIRSLLNPARELDLPDACPVCGADEWWDPASGQKFLRPLIIRYRSDHGDVITNGRALCRACEQVWSVRELAYELEVAEGLVTTTE